MKQKLFVPYEFALLAKEKGYTEDCIALYSDENLYMIYQSGEKGVIHTFDKSSTSIAAPLYQQLLDWFRKKHDLHLYVEAYGNDTYEGVIVSNFSKAEEGDTIFTTYYDALDDAIKDAFKLI